MWPAQNFVNKPTDYARYLTNLGVTQPPHYPIGVRRVHVNSPNVEGTVFQTFWNSKQRSYERGSISRWEYVMNL